MASQDEHPPEVTPEKEENESTTTPTTTKGTASDTTTNTCPAPLTLATALTKARKDLWNAQPIRPFAWVLNPLRTFVWDPSLAILSILLPALMPNETIDRGMTFCVVHITIPLVHGLYPNPKNNKILGRSKSQTDQNMQSTAKQSLLLQTGNANPPAVSGLAPPMTDLQSAFQGAVSFIVSAIGDIVGAMTNPKKFNGWVQAMTQFNAFLEASGVAAELQESILKPLWYGRLLDNMKILNDIQEEHFAASVRAKACRLGIGGNGCEDDSKTTRSITPSKEEEEEFDNVLLKTALQNGKTYMRFATAAYGTEMIRSALDREVDMEELETLQKAISVHTNIIREEDIKLIYAEQEDCNTNDRHVLHHFVAIDRQSKSIVLALRGTLSLSGAIVDVQGMAVDYCSGKAHQGIAEMAENVWKQSGSFVLNLLQEYPEYQLLITGHSLGAGTACLLTIKLYHEKLAQQKIVCYAFAPPPTFDWSCGGDTEKDTAPSPEIQMAMENTIAYIHDNDVVPFLSIPVVRRLAALLDAVDNQTEHLWFWKRWRIFYEYDKIPDNITQSVLGATKVKQRSIMGANDLIIPCKFVLWCQKDIPTNTFHVSVCDPKKVAQENIFLCQDMLSDHLPEQYENALDALVG